jgi:hypothetical protein
MDGTFNDIPLRQIISAETLTDSEGFVRTTLRVIGKPNPKLEQFLQLNSQALVILSSQEIEGKIVGYSADVHHWVRDHDWIEKEEEVMPVRRSSIEKIRAELAWVNEPVDPNVCGCRHVLCCEQEGHAVGKCTHVPTRTYWSFRLEYRCAICIEYESGGKKARRYMTAGWIRTPLVRDADLPTTEAGIGKYGGVTRE